jgi:hypothetical protein
MGTVSVPIMPHVGSFGGSDDVVLSLLDLAPPGRIRFKGSATGEGSPYQKIGLKIVNTSVKALASLGFAEFVSSRVSSNFFCSYMDLAITKSIQNEDKDSLISEAIFGIGFRLAIVAFDMDAKVNANFAAVASAGKIKGGMTSYQIISIGGGIDVIKTARPLITNLSGDFNVETLETIGFVEAELAKLLIGKNKFIPQLMSVSLDLDKMARYYSNWTNPKEEIHYMDLMRSQRYALQRAHRNRTLVEALDDLDKNPTLYPDIKRDVVVDFYLQILGVKENERPEKEPLKKRIRIMFGAGA